MWTQVFNDVDSAGHVYDQDEKVRKFVKGPWDESQMLLVPILALNISIVGCGVRVCSYSCEQCRDKHARSFLEEQTRAARENAPGPGTVGVAAACACCCRSIGSAAAQCAPDPGRCTFDSPDRDCCGPAVKGSCWSRLRRGCCGCVCGSVGCAVRCGGQFCNGWVAPCRNDCGCLNAATKWPAIAVRWLIILLCQAAQQFTAYVWLNDWSAESRRAFVSHLPVLLKAMKDMTKYSKEAKKRNAGR